MNTPLDLVRADLRDFAGYRSARSERLEGDAWLNANESPWPNLAEGTAGLRRYPEPQPQALRERLAMVFGCASPQLLVGRGSDEGIDLLVRALCEPGAGAIVTTSPTFGMYAVSARLHGVRVVDVPLIDRETGFACDFAAVGDATEREGARVVFLCSPGNPTGTALPLDAIEALARRLETQAVVVVDEAYQDYAQTTSAISLLGTCRNVAVLRTMSKAHALASARVGAVIADAELVPVLQRCQAPYPLPKPCVDAALSALGSTELAATRTNAAIVVRERARLAAGLRRALGVRHIYPSSANFLLVRFEDAQAAFDRLLRAGIVVRDMRALPGLEDALRITIGRPEQNERVVAAIAGEQVAA